MTVIKCYALTNDGNYNDEDQLCKCLQLIVEMCPGEGLTILARDLNAKVRMDNTGCEDIMRRHALEEKDENGGNFEKFMCIQQYSPKNSCIKVHGSDWLTLQKNM